MRRAVVEAAAAVLTACLGAGFLMLANPADAAPQPSRLAQAEFRKANPCPATGQARGACPGYVVSHVQPPCADRQDAAANLQWQTVAESREQDRWVRQYCQFRRARLQAQASA